MKVPFIRRPVDRVFRERSDSGQKKWAMTRHGRRAVCKRQLTNQNARLAVAQGPRSRAPARDEPDEVQSPSSMAARRVPATRARILANAVSRVVEVSSPNGAKPQ